MKTFVTDKQTLEDLNIFGKKAGSSIYGLFNRTHTRGGAEALEQMFQLPLADREAINRRSAAFRHFQQLQLTFPFQGEWLDIAEKYLENTDERSKLSAQDNNLGRKFSQMLGSDDQFQLIAKGIHAIAAILSALKKYRTVSNDSPLDKEIDITSALAGLHQKVDASGYVQGKEHFEQIAAMDQLFRFTYTTQLKLLLQYIYQLDVYISVAQVAEKKQLHYATALAGNSEACTKAEGVYHLLVENAKGNNISLTGRQNVFFLTGANMAGKSTLMKSLSIAVFLAHMGFPVPAAKMEFTVLDGMFTTINLSDNLDMGYSHFYAEVNRVKKVAKLLEQQKKLFIVFDELFRGTNVKDAYEATVAVTAAFTNCPSSLFIISSHILEAGETLKKSAQLQFGCLTTRMKGTKPVYTYQLEPGLSADRHGMIIIREEGILDQLAKSNSGNTAKEFITDTQTTEDLNLFGKYKNTSMFSLFNRTQTTGGERLLDQLFRHPLTNDTAINERSNMLARFSQLSLKFPVNSDELSLAEDFMKMGGSTSLLQTFSQRSRNLFMKYIGLPLEMEQVQKGLKALISFLIQIRDFHQQLKKQAPDHPFLNTFTPAVAFLEEERMAQLLSNPSVDRIWKIARYDYLLRSQLSQELNGLFKITYELDVYLGVAAIAREKQWVFAKALPAGETQLKLTGFYHPAIANSVTNSLVVTAQNPMIFLTGANMAGKSTLMKAYGIAVYLAHMGFPVAAREMEFSVKEGIYTSINVPDNLKEGYSHFYAEVLRVKMIAEEVSRSGNLLIIFDELFKGTNVKDAYDATLAVTTALTNHQQCVFMISTHITEVGEALQTDLPQKVQFVYLPTIMNGQIPTYPRILARGISADRHGMRIIRNEGILDIIPQAATV